MAVKVKTNFQCYFFKSRSIKFKLPRSFQGFRRTLRQNFIWILQQVNNFPIDLHCKILSLWEIFTMGVYWEILHLLSNPFEYRLEVCRKSSNDRAKFELDWARSKNNIAESLFSLSPEMQYVECHSLSTYTRLQLNSALMLYKKLQQELPAVLHYCIST